MDAVDRMGLAIAGPLRLKNVIALEDLFSRKLKVSSERPAEHQNMTVFAESLAESMDSQSIKRVPRIV